MLNQLSSSHLQSLTTPTHPTSGSETPPRPSNPYSLDVSNLRRQAPDIPLPKIPPPTSQMEDDDDLGVYEEMKSIKLPVLAAPQQPIRRGNSNPEDSDDYEGTGWTLATLADVHAVRVYL